MLVQSALKQHYMVKMPFFSSHYTEYNISCSDGQYEIAFRIIIDGVKALHKKVVSKYEITAIGIASLGEMYAMLLNFNFVRRDSEVV